MATDQTSDTHVPAADKTEISSDKEPSNGEQSNVRAALKLNTRVTGSANEDTSAVTDVEVHTYSLTTVADHELQENAHILLEDETNRGKKTSSIEKNVNEPIQAFTLAFESDQVKDFRYDTTNDAYKTKIICNTLVTNIVANAFGYNDLQMNTSITNAKKVCVFCYGVLARLLTQYFEQIHKALEFICQFRPIRCDYQCEQYLGVYVIWDYVQVSGPMSVEDRMQYEWHRRISFELYQGRGAVNELARNGFCHNPTSGHSATLCFACSLAIDNWEASDNVAEVHKRKSPTCPMLQTQGAQATRRNIPIAEEDGLPAPSFATDSAAESNNGRAFSPTLNMLNIQRINNNTLSREAVVCAYDMPDGVLPTNPGQPPESLPVSLRSPGQAFFDERLQYQRHLGHGRNEHQTHGRETDLRRTFQTCRQCNHRKVDAMLHPCCHLVVCRRCAQRLNKCPVCKKKTTGYLPVHVDWIS